MNNPIGLKLKWFDGYFFPYTRIGDHTFYIIRNQDSYELSVDFAFNISCFVTDTDAKDYLNKNIDNVISNINEYYSSLDKVDNYTSLNEPLIEKIKGIYNLPYSLIYGRLYENFIRVAFDDTHVSYITENNAGNIQYFSVPYDVLKKPMLEIKKMLIEIEKEKQEKVIWR